MYYLGIIQQVIAKISTVYAFGHVIHIELLSIISI